MDENNNLEEYEKREARSGSVEIENKKEEKAKSEIVMHYRKPSFFTSLLFILMGACIATAILACIYLFKIKDADIGDIEDLPVVEENESDEEKIESEVKVPEVDLDINGEFIKKLHAKIPSSDMIPYMSIYNSSKSTQGKITDSNKLLLVLLNMRMNEEYTTKVVEGTTFKNLTFIPDPNATSWEVNVYNMSDVEKNYRYIFGADKEVLRETVNHMAYVWDYDQVDDCFYGHTFPGGGGLPYEYASKIVSAEKSDDGKEIYIYDYFMSINLAEGNKINVFDGNDTYSIGEEENPLDENYNIRSDIIDKYIGNGLYKYKHTFKLDNTGNYYWYSTENTYNKE